MILSLLSLQEFSVSICAKPILVIAAASSRRSGPISVVVLMRRASHECCAGSTHVRPGRGIGQPPVGQLPHRVLAEARLPGQPFNERAFLLSGKAFWLNKKGLPLNKKGLALNGKLVLETKKGAWPDGHAPVEVRQTPAGYEAVSSTGGFTTGAGWLRGRPRNGCSPNSASFSARLP